MKARISLGVAILLVAFPTFGLGLEKPTFGFGVGPKNSTDSESSERVEDTNGSSTNGPTTTESPSDVTTTIEPTSSAQETEAGTATTSATSDASTMATSLPSVLPSSKDYDCVPARYVPWANKTEEERNTLADGLSYIPETWDVEFTNERVEKKSFASLTGSERSVAEAMGYQEESWDCWVNHYEDYDWNELGELVQGLLQAVSYSRGNWDGEMNYNDTDFYSNKNWDDLSETERRVADEMCFFRENWDGWNLTDYEWQCSPTTDSSVEATTPTIMTTPTPPPALPSSPDVNCVAARYVPWANKTEEERKILADDLKYSPETWDVELANERVETKSFSSLTGSQRTAAQSIGFLEDSWDCWVNHYEDYDWIDLGDELRVLLEEVSYGRVSWDGEHNYNDPDNIFNKDWDNLNEAELNVADKMCLFRENWESWNLADYEWQCDESPSSVGATTPAIMTTTTPLPLLPSLLPSSTEFSCVPARYVPWERKSEEERNTLTNALSYSQDTWDVELTNEDVESKSFGDLTRSQRRAAESMGFQEESWDCWVNHYDGYGWNDLEELKPLLKKVGYRKVTWDGAHNDNDPENMFNKDWDDLTAIERQVADRMCFFREIWESWYLDEYEWQCDSLRSVSSSSERRGHSRHVADWVGLMVSCLAYYTFWEL